MRGFRRPGWPGWGPGRRSVGAGPPRFAEAAAGNRGLGGDVEAMLVKEAGEPAGAGEDLAVDPGVARVLSQFGRCGGGAEDLAETVVFPGGRLCAWE